MIESQSGFRIGKSFAVQIIRDQRKSNLSLSGDFQAVLKCGKPRGIRMFSVRLRNQKDRGRDLDAARRAVSCMEIMPSLRGPKGSVLSLLFGKSEPLKLLGLFDLCFGKIHGMPALACPLQKIKASGAKPELFHSLNAVQQRVVE